MIPKPAMIVMPAHPTNTWPRYGTRFEFIVMHYVGAVSTARNNGAYYGNTPNLGASAHYFVDEHEIVSSVPLDRAAGHCGVDYSGGKAPYWNGSGAYSTNRRSIGIEMCCKRTAAGEWYIEPETVTRTVALVKWLMQEFNIPVSNVIRHYDVCWKTCPEPWVRFPEQWTAFKARLTGADIGVAPAPSPAPEKKENKPNMKTLRKNNTYDYQVKVLQTLLKLNGFDPGAADGYFGGKTNAAVVAFQKKKGLDPDGIVGPLTWAALLGV
jgi:N-acetylmuramoyl-L-alanine amidase CwlA